MTEAREQVEETVPVNEVGVVLEALERVGIANEENCDELTETLANDFEVLDKSGAEGVYYPWIPEGLVPLDQVIQALNDETGVAAYVDGRLWTPGEKPDGYSAEDLAAIESGRPGDEVPTHTRAAIRNPGNPEEPLLHFLNQSFDEFRADDGEETQLVAFDKAKTEYERVHEDLSMIPLNAKGLAMIALMQQIKGEPLPLDGYQLRDATLPRLNMMGIPLVGDVRSDGERLRFISSFGFSRDVSGIGLSAGPDYR